MATSTSALEHARIDGALAQMRDRRERLPRPRRQPRLPRLAACGRCCRPARQLVGLVGERPPARIHLEQHRLGRLACEPELAALGVVAVALGRDHRSVRRVEQLRGRDEPEAVEQAQRRRIAGGELAERPGTLDGRRRGGGGVAVDDDGEAAEPVLARALEQLEPALCVAGEHRGCAPGERRRDRTLRARLCLERRERERLARRGERARGRWDPLALGDRALERLQPLAWPSATARRRRRARVAAARAAAVASLARCLELGGREARRGARSHAPPRARRSSVSTSVAADSCRRPSRSRAAPSATSRRLAPSWPPVASASAASTPPRSARSSASRDSAAAASRRSYAATRACAWRARSAAWPCASAASRAAAAAARAASSRIAHASRRCGRLRRARPRRDRPRSRCSSSAADSRRSASRSRRALEAVEGAERRLAAAGGVGQLVLGLLALLEQRGELLLRAAARDRDCVAASLGVGPALGDGEQVELRDPRPQRRDLDRELLGPLGGGRLERERAQPLAHLLLDVLRALDLGRDAGELELGPVLAALELAEPGGLLDEVAPVLRLRGEHRVDLALRDDRVHRAAEPDVGEQLDEIGAPHGSLVDEVLALAATDEPARDRDLAVVDLVAEAAVLVVEDELDLAVIRRRRGSRPPPKSTSSGFSARSSDGVSEPAAQTIASATFDLPEPFGPTTTATPGSSLSSIGSTNDLKPRILIDWRCTSGER